MSWFLIRVKAFVPALLLAIFSLQGSCLQAAGFKVQRIAAGLDQPVDVVQAPGDTSSIYVLEGQTNDFDDNNGSGQIIQVDLANGSKTSFLRIQDIHRPREGGLHGLAFHPDYQANGKFYVSWVKNPNGGSNKPQARLDEYQLHQGVPTLSRTLIDLTHLNTAPWHNIDWIGFEPGATGNSKEHLYVTLGDGGLQADNPNFTAESQDLSSIRGKVLRIDLSAPDAYPVDAARNYGYPVDNPFADDGDANTLGEVFHYGLRNPWRASFDSATGDLFIGDVGYNTSEEINYAQAGESGLDFGWSQREGTLQTPVVGVGGPQGNSVNPIFELLHDDDKGLTGIGSITGGRVYRGPITELQGQYFFAEAAAGEILSGVFDRTTDSSLFNGNNITNFTIRTDELNSLIEGEGEINVVVSFGEDAHGHLYLVDFSNGGFGNQFGQGEVYRLIPDLAADFNDDGLVNAADLAKWKLDFGNGNGSDADGDGDSDGMDLLGWQAAMSSPPTLASARVPEPTATGLLTAALAVLTHVRRRSTRRNAT